MRRHALLLSVFFFFSCFLLLLPSCNTRQQPIKIGMSINLSGRGGEAGEHIRDGALLAVEKVNSRGGINGRPLELLVRDDKNTGQGIRAADESLIGEGVVAIIGHSYSSSTVKALPYVSAHNTLLITAYTATTSLSGRDDLFFRTSVDCALYGRKVATLLKKRNVHSVAFLMDMTNPDFVLDYAGQVKKYFFGSTTEVRFESRDQADWTRILQDLLQTRPDAIVLLTEAGMTGVALQKLQEADYKGLRIATLWAQTPSLMRYAGASAEGLSIVTFINPDNTRPAYLAFAHDIQETFHKKANARSTRSYEMIMILADALSRCPTLSTDALKKALSAKEYNTLMGRVRFDKYGDVVRPVYEVIVRKNRFRNNGEL